MTIGVPRPVPSSLAHVAVFSVGLVRLAAERARNAASNLGGNFLPRFSARRRIPAAARALREKREGAFGSRTSDNEHAAASLWDSEVASVQHAPGEEPLWPDSDTGIPPTVSGDSGVEAADLADDEREIFASVVVSGDSGFLPVPSLGTLGAGATGQKAGDVLEKHVSIAFISDTYELVEQSGP